MDAPDRKYRKCELPRPEDTTLRDGQLLTPAFLRHVGELLFGERWQTPLAHGLGSLRGKALSPATIHQWSTSTRSIPGWVEDALARLLEQGQTEFRQRAERAERLARRMRTRNLMERMAIAEPADSVDADVA